MAITRAFEDAVNKRDMQRVRIMMKNSLLADPRFDEYESMKALVQKEIPDSLFVADKGQSFETDKAKWTDDYMNRVLYDAVNDFTERRMRHAQDVVRYRHPVADTAPRIRTTALPTDATQTQGREKAEPPTDRARNAYDARQNVAPAHRPAASSGANYGRDTRRTTAGRDGASSHNALYALGGAVGGAVIGGLAAWALEASVATVVLSAAAVGVAAGAATALVLRERDKNEH